MKKPDETNRSQPRQPATNPSPGRILALDLGSKRVGVAVCDELRLTVRPLPALTRTNWKQLLREVTELCRRFDVQTVVIGLPLSMDGSEGDAALDARRIARNMALSLNILVELQDERLTSHAAEEYLREMGCSREEIKKRVDGEAAALILRDYLAQSGTQS